MSDALVFDSIAQANLPMRDKSVIRKWVDRVSQGTMGMVGVRARSHVVAGGNALRQGAESAVVGGALGMLHAELPTGLDMVVKGHNVALDGAGGLLALGASIAFGGEDMHHELRNAGAMGVGVFAFRKGYDFIAAKKIAAGQKPGGAFGPAQTAKVAGEIAEGMSDMGEEEIVDPVVACAKALSK